MYEIHVAVRFDAPPEQVFDALTDYEHFFSAAGLPCRVLQPGHETANGLGAMREVTAGGNVFTEEITAFDPPRHFEYVVRSLKDRRGRPVRMRHERGWLDIVSDGAATRVDWYSRFQVTIPLVGWFAERIVGPRAAKGFRQLLARARAELEGGRSAKASYPNTQ